MSNDLSAHPLVRKARRFAVNAHSNINHRRKYTGDPYWVHPRNVAKYVGTTPGHTAEMLAAAWLHDTVEDTPTTLDDINREFGPLVGAYVEYLTDISVPSDGNRAKRKAIDRAHIASVPVWWRHAVHTVKLADLIDNTVSICRHDRRFARVYLAEKSALLDVMRGDAELHYTARMMTATYTKHLY
jgi:(p)ppGpp synthase/HD superfamily hydrolase